MTGKFAVSAAGHDKERIYVIVAQEGGYVYLCDGELKPVGKPKKKKEKHIQIINRSVDKELRERLLSGGTVRDEEIRAAIRQYRNWRQE